MPTSAIQRAAQLRLDKTLGSQKPERRFRDATNSDREENTKARRSPQARHTALRLAKTLVTGGRDKQKSFVNQAAGELAARE